MEQCRTRRVDGTRGYPPRLMDSFQPQETADKVRHSCLLRVENIYEFDKMNGATHGATAIQGQDVCAESPFTGEVSRAYSGQGQEPDGQGQSA